jgi:hypothetical protein
VLFYISFMVKDGDVVVAKDPATHLPIIGTVAPPCVLARSSLAVGGALAGARESAAAVCICVVARVQGCVAWRCCVGRRPGRRITPLPSLLCPLPPDPCCAFHAMPARSAPRRTVQCSAVLCCAVLR